MRSSLKLLGRSALLVAICVAVGFALLLAAFALPTEPMRENALASQGVFAREGSYPMVRTLGVDAKLDNFTDSMMLVQAGYQAPETTLLQRTLNVYRPFPHGNRERASMPSPWPRPPPRPKAIMAATGTAISPCSSRFFPSLPMNICAWSTPCGWRCWGSLWPR